MKITGRVFFRSISVRNKEFIPARGPLMVLANHPGTFMDPIVIATMLDREVYFLAKGELFKGWFAKWLLPKFNMIPVYRKQDDPAQMSKNEETFKKCFEHLERGGAILMFPEGTSITERKLRPIKTGAARIVLGAEERNNFRLDTQIVTIGLNYVNPHKFNRDLFINIETPIKALDYREDYKQDTFKGAEKLTETIRSQLEKLIIAIDNQQTDDLVQEIESLYKYKLSKDLGIPENNKQAEFDLTKSIVEAVGYYRTNHPEQAEQLRSRIKAYLNNLKHLGLQDSDISKNQKSRSFLAGSVNAVFTILLGFPVYLYGLINNYLPFEIPGWIANRISKSIEFRGPIAMVAGMFTFLIFYTIQIALVWKFSNLFWLTLVYAFSLPLTGFFAYWYFHTVSRIRAKWVLMMTFYKKSVLVSGLITEREQIIARLDKVKSEYLNRNIR